MYGRFFFISSFNDLKKPKLYGSPIKNLTFSPSKFLNTSTMGNDLSDKLLLDTSKDGSVSSNVSDVDDSGIVVSDVTLSDEIGVMPLTSTPSASSRRKPQKLFENLNKTVDHSTDSSENFDSENCYIKTPQIRKFLNTSVPKTPTPIKFPKSSEVLIKQENGSVKKLVCKSFSASMCNERSNNVYKSRTNSNTSVADQSCHFRRNLFNENHNFDKEKIKLIKIECKSSLNCRKLILKKHKTVPYEKMVPVGINKNKRERTTSLNDQWVSIACGRSHDQRIMTVAAKKCMEAE